jgi:flavin prenyltransferase
MNKRKVVVAVTGASGSIYAMHLLRKLSSHAEKPEVGVVFSDNARDVWEFELGSKPEDEIALKIYSNRDFFAPFASGSAQYDTMIICPCSMGTLARIANGLSDDLTTRAADVMLKERRRLILALRDTPFSLIHINNMKAVTEAGAIVAPAAPSFYSKPKDLDALALTVVDRLIDLAGLSNESYRWSE